jgi:hypothetical protein
MALKGAARQTLCGMKKIPAGNHIRALLDAVSPEALHPYHLRLSRLPLLGKAS